MVKCAAAALAALALARAADAAPPGCQVEVSLRPERAFVGQQVLHRVRVLRRGDVSRVDWAVPPAFGSARAELLPPEPRGGLERDGSLLHVHDELRALFPEQSGVLSLGAARLRCESAQRPDEELAVPPVRLEVLPLPEAGRPAGFDGLVGPLMLHVTVSPLRLALGQSLRVAVMARGAGNLWLLEAPFPESAFGDAEVFARAPELAFERGRELYVRQHLALDVVPRAAGSLRIPALRVPYFDPERGVYREATTEEVEVSVEERAAAPAQTGIAHAAPAPGARPRRAAAWRGRLVLAGAAALAAGGGWLVWRRRRPDAAAAQALADAARARSAGDAARELAAQAQALRAALARHVAGAAALSAEELAAAAESPAARGAAALLAALERARFEPGAAPPAPDAVERAVRALAAGRARRTRRRAASAALLVGLALGSGAALSGCATRAGRDAPMTPARLESWLREETHDFEVVDNQLRFVFGGVRMICVHDVRGDRVRIVAAVVEESTLTVVSARILLQANFGETLDARYAIREGMLYAVYHHPLSTLESRQLESALTQVANLVHNYGSTFSVRVPGGR